MRLPPPPDPEHDRRELAEHLAAASITYHYGDRFHAALAQVRKMAPLPAFWLELAARVEAEAKERRR